MSSFHMNAPVLDAPVLDACGVAALLAMGEAEFLARRSRLTREHGFPRALPGLGRRWSAYEVAGWIDACGGRAEGRAQGFAQAATAESGPAALPARKAEAQRKAEAERAARAEQRRDDLVAQAQRALEARYVGNVVAIGRRA